MLALTRTTKTVSYNGEIISEPFTQVLPVFTNQSPEDAMAELIQSRIIKNKTMCFATDDWFTKSNTYFPIGAGDYEYNFVDLPKTEKFIMVLGNIGFENYYNDEYTRSGDCEFFAGPYPDMESARLAGRDLMDKFVYKEWSYENEISTSDEYTYDCEGQYVSMKVVEIDVIP